MGRSPTLKEDPFCFWRQENERGSRALKFYFVYDRQTGEILRSGACPDVDFDKQGQDGAVVGEGEIKNENYVVDGVPVYIEPPPPPPPTPEELAAIEDIQRLRLLQRVMFKVALNHENRIRALEGKQPVTAEQFKTALEEL